MTHHFSFIKIRVLVITGLLSITGCSGESPESPDTTNRAASNTTVLARIDETVITTADLEHAIMSTPRPGQIEYINPPQRKELLESLIDRKLMARQARSDGLHRDPAVAKALEKVANDPFESERMLAQTYLNNQLSAGQVTGAEIEAYYQDQPAEFTEAERARVTRVILPDEDTARRAREWLLEGIDADELKIRTAGRGQVGTLWLQQQEEPGPMERVAFVLDKGEVSTIFSVNSGLVVLRVDERISARLRPLTEVRAGIAARLDQERRLEAQTDLLEDLRKNAVVSIDQEALAAFQWQD